MNFKVRKKFNERERKKKFSRRNFFRIKGGIHNKKWNSRFFVNSIPKYDILKDKHAKTFVFSKNFRGGKKNVEKKNSKKKEIEKRSVSLPPSRKSSRIRKISSIFTENVAKTPSIQSSSSTHLLEMFRKTQKKLLQLQKALIPKVERQSFYRTYLILDKSDESKIISNLNVLNNELLTLLHYDDLSEKIKREIENREFYLKNLKDVLSLFTSSKNSLIVVSGKKKNFLRDSDIFHPNFGNYVGTARATLGDLRSCSLRIIDLVTSWRKMHSDKTQQFVWKKRNYLLKMQHDLTFFMESSLGIFIDEENERKDTFFSGKHYRNEERDIMRERGSIDFFMKIKIKKAEKVILDEKKVILGKKKREDKGGPKVDLKYKTMIDSGSEWSRLFYLQNLAAIQIQRCCKSYLMRKRREKVRMEEAEGVEKAKERKKILKPIVVEKRMYRLRFGERKMRKKKRKRKKKKKKIFVNKKKAQLKKLRIVKKSGKERRKVEKRRRDSAIAIQRVWRGYKERKRVKKMQEIFKKNVQIELESENELYRNKIENLLYF